MDGEDVSQADFAACLEDLARVNTLTLARWPTLSFIEEVLAASPAGEAPIILDVGFGAGDMLRAIDSLCQRHGTPARLIGIDLNPRSKPAAAQMTPPQASIDYRTGDLFAWSDDEPIDIVISASVTHHMSDDEIRRFLTWMENRSRMGWFINDLNRHAFAYHGFRLLSAMMPWHPFIGHDGPISIARSFRREDWLRLLRDTDLDHAARIEWRFPFRFCVSRRKW